MTLSKENRVLLFLILMLLPSLASAQVVSNPDFEESSDCPPNIEMIFLLDNWFETVLSADYYDCGLQEPFFPTDSDASSGTGYVGFATYGSPEGAAESIGQTLSQPMSAGAEYTFEVDVKMVTGGTYSDICTGLCVYGFTSMPNQNMINVHISTEPGAVELACTETIDHTDWQTYSVSFTAAEDFTHLVFSPGYSPGCGQYMFMDNIQLVEGNSSTTLVDFCEGESVLLESGLDDTATWYETDGENQNEIGNGSDLELTPTGDMEILVVEGDDEVAFILTEISFPEFGGMVITDPSAAGLCDGVIDFDVPAGIEVSINGDAGNPPFSDLCEGDYTLILANGDCVTTEEITLSTEPPCVDPTIGIVSVLPENCENSNGSVEVLAQGEGDIEYRLVDFISWQPEAVFENLSSGNYTIEARVTGGCTASVNVTIYREDNIELRALSIDNVSCPGETDGAIDLEVLNAAPPYIFDLSNTTSQDTGYFSNLSVGHYRALVTDSFGCTADYPFQIDLSFENADSRCNCEVFIPNALTVDDDDLNEVWIPVANCPITAYHLQVFDRWGHVVFETKDPKAVWNGGTESNYYVPNDVYAYRLTYQWGVPSNLDSDVHLDTGTITVFR